MKRNMHWLGTLAICTMAPACDGAAGNTELDSVKPNAVTKLELVGDGYGDLGHRVPPCEQLAQSLNYPDTVYTSSTTVPAGQLKLGGQDIPAHCLLTGTLQERVSPTDGQTYAIGFEMRLPLQWNRRFFYQANGGLDGIVVPATGDTSGGGPLTGALLQGFAVISSDAGHNAAQNPVFGLDPQARLDFGYQAVGKLTPMAKRVLLAAYWRRPAYSYIGGCSNGGRHALVAASRYADQYDGYLVGSPGLDLPKAAVSSIYGAQQYAPLAGGAVIPGGPFAGLPDLSAAFNPVEAALLSSKVLERCDALDGVADGLVQRTQACQQAFNLDRDVPTCPGARDGTCLTAAQKVAIGNAFSGGQTSTGSALYTRFPFDSGHAASGSGFWDFVSPLILDAGAVGFIFGTPPANPATFVPPLFALTSNIDQLYASIFATSGVYTEASQSFMVPPDPSDLSGLRRRGARMLVYHGVSDPIFSAEHTRLWFENLNQSLIAQQVARLYLVPGMNHCSGGPATDQFDLLTPLIQWVEQGQAPREIIASVRGPSNPGGFNFELPPTWSPDRTRPLCPYPRVAHYEGGDIERAESFACRR